MSRERNMSELWDAIVEDCGCEVLFTDEGLTVFDDEGFVIAHGEDFQEVLEDMEDHVTEFFVRVVRKYVHARLPKEGILA